MKTDRSAEETVNYQERAYRVFELFDKQWGVVAAGSPECFNACTISWGSMGTLWTRPGKSGSVITVYLHPARYTREFMADSDTFTVSFFPPEYRQALSILGTRSGRDGDKVSAAGLTPVAMGDSVGFREASLSFLCRKLYQHTFSKEDIAPDVQAYYRSHPAVYPVDENGEWQPHWMFVGEIIDAVE